MAHVAKLVAVELERSEARERARRQRRCQVVHAVVANPMFRSGKVQGKFTEKGPVAVPKFGSG